MSKSTPSDGPDLLTERVVGSSSVLIVSDSAHTNELFAGEVRRQLGVPVHSLTSSSAVGEDAVLAGYRLAVVEMEHVSRGPNGIDVLLAITRRDPQTKLLALVGAEPMALLLLREAWRFFDLVGVVGLRIPVAQQLGIIESALSGQRGLVHESLVDVLDKNPSMRVASRSLEDLVEHAGHAKLWRALIDCEADPTYQDLAARTGLKLNTIRNYREQLLPELRKHGLSEASLRDMWAFAQRLRSLIEPVVRSRQLLRRSA